MTISLLKMTELEYNDFLSFAIKDFAKNKVEAGTWNEQEALELSKKGYQKLLSKGVDTVGEYLFTIINEETKEKLGYLWFHLDDVNKPERLFIYDFVIFEKFRNLGYGKKTLNALDEQAKLMGISEIELHVFAHNHRAIHVYEELGFIPTDINMLKRIK